MNHDTSRDRGDGDDEYSPGEKTRRLRRLVEAQPRLEQMLERHDRNRWLVKAISVGLASILAVVTAIATAITALQNAMWRK